MSKELGGRFMDFLKQIVIHQSYVPRTCLMEGRLAWLIVKDGKDPCAECNEDRDKCEGRPKEK